MDEYTGSKINELLIVFLIVLQVLDFFRLLTPVFEYVEKVISWALIAYLFYLVSPSTLFFGERRRGWDASVIIAYFLMTLKNVLNFAIVARDAMLEEISKYALFLPGEGAAAGVVTIPLEEGAYNAFVLFGIPFENAAAYAKPFATQLTMNAPTLPFTVQAGNQTAAAVLQPVGADGAILQVYNTLAQHAFTIERLGFIIGALLLLGLGVYAAYQYHVRDKSVLKVLHETGPVKGAFHALARVLAVWFVMTAFFIIFFNLLVEWLVIAVDSALTMAGIAVYAWIVIRFSRRTRQEVDEEDLLSRVGSFGTDFLGDFAALFCEWKTVLLGLSGLLVLHLITDAGVFLIPYLTGLEDQVYLARLGPGHDVLWTVFANSAATASLAVKGALLALYALNVVGLLALLVLPAYIWYKAFRIRTRAAHEDETAHHPQLSRWLTSLGIAGIVAFLVVPAFRVASAASRSIVGVDVQTRAITTAQPFLVLSILAAVFLVTFVVASVRRFHHYCMAALFLGPIVFFGVYTYKYFFSAVTHYLNESFLLFGEGTFAAGFLGTWLLLYLVVSLLFYAFGYCSYVYEAVRD